MGNMLEAIFEARERENRAFDAYKKYSDVPSSVLSTEKPVHSEPVDDAEKIKKDAEARKAQASATQHEQDNDHRKNFFWFAVTLAGICIVGNFAVFGVYMGSQWESISDGVMIAWISATIVEVLGIVTIIAQYLFGGKR